LSELIIDLLHTGDLPSIPSLVRRGREHLLGRGYRPIKFFQEKIIISFIINPLFYKEGCPDLSGRGGKMVNKIEKNILKKI
jgi:hypothetical protein